MFVIQILHAHVSWQSSCALKMVTFLTPGQEKETSVQGPKISSDFKRDFHEVEGNHH